MIQIDTIGVIESGDEAGNQVKIIDDSNSTGGYLILTGKDLSNPNIEAFDSWVASMTDLQGFFNESKWVVKWQ